MGFLFWFAILLVGVGVPAAWLTGFRLRVRVTEVTRIKSDGFGQRYWAKASWWGAKERIIAQNEKGGNWHDIENGNTVPGSVDSAADNAVVAMRLREELERNK